MLDQALACLATTIFMEARGEGIPDQSRRQSQCPSKK